MLLLDTNVYIASFNDRTFGAAFATFHRENLPRIVLSSVVVHELLIGARTPERRRALDRGLLEPFRSRRRVHVPALSTWKLAADLDRRLRRRGGLESSLGLRSFGNDLLLAATAREIGATLITLNLVDFELIREVVDLKLAPPWPSRS